MVTQPVDGGAGIFSACLSDSELSYLAITSHVSSIKEEQKIISLYIEDMKENSIIYVGI